MNKEVIMRVICSLILAFAIVNAFFFFYYNPGTHIDNTTGATDYRWEGNTRHYDCTEGFATTTVDAAGFHNKEVINNPDILIVGSSHMEGTHVSDEENIGSLVQCKFPDMKVYNIGVSGHTFPICVRNYEKAVEVYKPRYVVIETASLDFKKKDLENAVDGKETKLKSVNSGLFYELQKFPYLKQIYAQLKSMKISDVNHKQNQGNQKNNESEKADKKVIDGFVEMLYNVNQYYGIKTIVVYHPTFKLNKEIAKYEMEKVDGEDEFECAFNKYGIYYINLADRFDYEYRNNHVLPYGFINTNVGVGHMNKYGIEMMTDEVVKKISEINNSERI